MDLLPVGRFGPKALAEKIGTISRMLPDGSVGFLRSTCRKDSSATDADVLALCRAQGDDSVSCENNSETRNDEDEIDLSRFASEKDARAYFKRKLAIFEASMMTPITVNRRLAVRKLEMEGGFGEPCASECSGMIDESDCIPPRQLLMYLVRYVYQMGGAELKPRADLTMINHHR
uniref:Uncharacterized protein n=1 Tax=Anopheles christyi TaxID=43041 RepID=A0A182K730_9DIPT